MKIEEAMYVRFKIYGYERVSQLMKIDKERFEVIDNKKTNSVLVLGNTNIIKASHNIIDLIKVGDYVNGYRVAKICKDKNGNITDIAYAEETNGQLYSIGDIKTVITKEQFSQMEYKVVE